MAEPTEDVPYIVDDFAIEDELSPADSKTDQITSTKLIRDVLKYLRTEITKSNSLDILNLPDNASDADKIAAFNMAAIHKGVVFYLRNAESVIINKLKEQ